MLRRRVALFLCLLLCAASTAPVRPLHAAEPAAQRAQTSLAVMATVKLWILSGDDVRGTCSGAVVHPEGYILTAWHCVGKPDGTLYHAKGWLGVGPTFDARVEPKPTYVAGVKSGSPRLDLAVLKIFRMVDPAQPLPDPLWLPALPVAPADDPTLGQQVHVLGYPEIGGPLLTAPTGTVTGFHSRTGSGIDAFKHDVQTASGHSGGPVINGNGRLVGVHTSRREEGATRVNYATLVAAAQPLMEEAGGSLLGAGDVPVEVDRAGSATYIVGEPIQIAFAAPVGSYARVVSIGPAGTRVVAEGWVERPVTAVAGVVIEPGGFGVVRVELWQGQSLVASGQSYVVSLPG